MGALRHALAIQGIVCIFPPDRVDTPLYFDGQYNLSQIADTAERQADCQADYTVDRISFTFPSDGNFLLIEPDVFSGLGSAQSGTPSSLGVGGTGSSVVSGTSNGLSIAGDTVTSANGYCIISGPLTQLSRTRDILQVLLRRPQQIQLQVYLVDDSLSNNIDIVISPGTSPVPLNDITSVFFDATATINAFHQAGAVVTEFLTLLQSGQLENYTDQDQRVVQEFAASQFTPTSNSSPGQGSGFLNSGLSTRTAGLNLQIVARAGPGFWKVDGSFSDSTFSGTSALADEISRTLAWTVNMRPGELVRVCTITQTQLTKALGVNGNDPTLNSDRSADTFSLWVRIAAVQPTDYIEPIPSVNPLPDLQPALRTVRDAVRSIHF